MPYCPNCGHSVGADSKFCENCGYKLNPSASPQVQMQQYTVGPANVSGQDIINDPVIKNYPPVTPPPDLPFRLQEGELILKAIKPSRRIIVKFSFSGIITTLFIFLFFIVPVSLSFVSSAAHAGGSVLFLIVIGFIVLVLIILLVSVFFGYLGYKKYSYWITNHRTIGKRGIIGFTIDSMPLENIADVIVARGIIDRILGISTLYIQPIGGSGFMVPVRGLGMNRYGGTNNFMGINPVDAPEIQQLIFHLRDLRKRETGKIL